MTTLSRQDRIAELEREIAEITAASKAALLGDIPADINRVRRAAEIVPELARLSNEQPELNTRGEPMDAATIARGRRPADSDNAPFSNGQPKGGVTQDLELPIRSTVAKTGPAVDARYEGSHSQEEEHRRQAAEGLRAPSPAPLPEPQDVRPACDWPPNEPFRFADEPGEHDPCYVVMPGGAMLPLNHHAGPGIDIARAKFIVDACNAALAQSDAQPVAREIGPTHVICPNCCHDFRAISQADRAALAQSDARPIGWQAKPIDEPEWSVENSRFFSTPTTSSALDCRPLYTTPPALPEEAQDARLVRMAHHCCIPEIDEPFFVLLGRDPQAPGLVEKWALDRQYCEPAEDEKWTSAAKTAVEMRAWKLAHPERGMSIEAFAKIAPPRRLIEAAEWPKLESAAKHLEDVLQYPLGSVYNRTGVQAALVRLKEVLRSRAPRFDKGGA